MSALCSDGSAVGPLGSKLLHAATPKALDARRKKGLHMCRGTTLNMPLAGGDTVKCDSAKQAETGSKPGSRPFSSSLNLRFFHSHFLHSSWFMKMLFLFRCPGSFLVESFSFFFAFFARKVKFMNWVCRAQQMFSFFVTHMQLIEFLQQKVFACFHKKHRAFCLLARTTKTKVCMYFFKWRLFHAVTS